MGTHARHLRQSQPDPRELGKITQETKRVHANPPDQKLQVYFERVRELQRRTLVLSQILKLRNNAAQEYFRYWVDLEGKKDKLFMTGDVTKWEIDFNEIGLTPEDVTKNKKVAKMLMLPGQTAVLKQMQKFFGYMNVQMMEQTEYLGLKQAKRYVRALTELCNEHIQNYSDVGFSHLGITELHEPQQRNVQHL